MKKTILNLLSFVDVWLFNFLAKRHLICFCLEDIFGGDTTIEAQDPIDIRKAISDYVTAVSDPRLQEKTLAAEARYRPEYTALELADIGTFARGTEEGRVNPRYEEVRREDAGFKSIQKKLKAAGGDSTSDKFQNSLGAGEQYYLNNLGLLGEDEDGNPKQFSTLDIEREIQRTEGQLKDTSKTLEGTDGLFDLLGESSTRAADLQRQQLGQQRAADVAALQKFAPRVVQAYRDADPESTRLAEMASARAGQETGLGEVGRGLLSPTEQEALISGRGTEFIQSTGELSPLEQRRAQQSSRQASLARGREMGQGSLYDEMLARQAEELNKQERQVALGSQLLGQEAGMRGARLGQAAGFIGQEEGIQSGRFGQAFGMNRALAGDAGNIILGRPSAAIGLGQQTLGQAQAGAAGPMGPQLFDPNVGINMAMQNQANQFGLLGAQAQADASRSAGFMGAIGSGIGAYAALCWVAREVYGIENPKWIQFRNWMLNDSPSWFRNLYIKYGERFAKFISNKPVLKNIIRKWMNTKIK